LEKVNVIMEKKMILKAQNITKSFPGVKALSDVTLELYSGEVMALVGENGAGKSTLIKILAGAQPPDSGTIEIEGNTVNLKNPTEAKKVGISVVYQELTFVSELTVAENLYINQYGLSSQKSISWKKIYQMAREALDAVGLSIDLDKKIKDCSVAEKQQIEIARAVYEKAKVLILDEPTSALNEQEINTLLDLVKKLKTLGVSTVFISHKMNEVFAISDKVVVLRDGQVITTKDIVDTNPQELVTSMAGREVGDMYPTKTNTPGDIKMSVKRLANEYIKDVSFDLRKGEILGVYGLMGSGHIELGLSLFGCVKKTTGSIQMDGKEITLKSPRECLSHGMSFLPSDRKTEGLVLIQSVQENIMTPYYETDHHSKIIKSNYEKKIAEKWIKDLAIKTPSKDTKAESLSGGNQQKVVLAKWLVTHPQIVIMNEPTRGIDVGAKAEIYKILNSLTEEGKSIIMITSEMPELMAMSDHVIVMHEGTVTGTFSKEEITQDNIMSAAIGGLNL